MFVLHEDNIHSLDLNRTIPPAPSPSQVLIRWWVASVTFGCAAIVGSLTLPLLPETRNRSMPDTLQALDERRSKRKGNPGETVCVNNESEESRL